MGRPSVSVAGTSLSGRVHGGQQPVAGASISLYAAGTTGNGSGAVDLLLPHTVKTDAAGDFNITGDYTCPTATTQMYLVARGGDPGLSSGAQNPALVLTAALGDCGNLSASTAIFVDEVTTVAVAWALAPFFGSGALAGSTATNTTGLRNGFANAALLADSATGTSPGASLPAGSATEPAKIYSLANALAPCVNSDGASACTPLFQASTVGGLAPANTLDAALNIVRVPGSNVAAVFQSAAANAPFQPALMQAPNDWTVSITYGNCTSGCGGLNLPGSLAIDSTGSVWVANYFGSVVSKFSPQGVPAAPNGYPGVGLEQSYGIAVDPLDNVWVANEQSTTAAGNSHRGSLSKFSASGLELSGNGFTGGGVYYPQAVAVSSSGGVWVADYAGSSASLLAEDGTAISPSTGYAAAQLPFTSAVALDAGGNAWFAEQKGVGRVTSSGATTIFPCCTELTGIAIDQSGNVWAADYGSFSVVELSSTGQVEAQVSTAAAEVSPKALAIDGAGNVWAANYYGNSITAITATNASLRSPAGGFGRDAALNEPYALAIDASGDLWLSNSGNNTVTVLLGLANPIKTPLLGPPNQP